MGIVSLRLALFLRRFMRVVHVSRELCTFQELCAFHKSCARFIKLCTLHTPPNNIRVRLLWNGLKTETLKDTILCVSVYLCIFYVHTHLPSDAEIIML